MTQEQVHSHAPERTAEHAAIAIPPSGVDTEKLKSDIDAILDEIDETLSEEEAATTVASYVQKGGQ